MSGITNNGANAAVPVEDLLKIFSCSLLTPRDVLRASRVSRCFLVYARDNPLWRVLFQRAFPFTPMPTTLNPGEAMFERFVKKVGAM